MPTPRQRFFRVLPVALLLVAITVHGLRIELRGEDPQRGSAFAMFSTVDIGATRRVIATVGDGAIVLEIPETLHDARERLVDAPSADAANRLGAQLLELSWQVDGDTAAVGDDVTFDVARVRVIGLDADGWTLSSQTIADVVVRRPGS